MLLGCAGIGLSHLLIGFAYAQEMRGTAVLVFTVCALGCYAMSLAPITWVLIAEIFPNRIRGAAISVAVSALWIACFALTFMFPLLRRSVGMAGTFWIYSAVCFFGLAFVYLRVPETKNKSLEQLERELGA
jgi:MFS family permease